MTHENGLGSEHGDCCRHHKQHADIKTPSSLTIYTNGSTASTKNFYTNSHCSWQHTPATVKLDDVFINDFMIVAQHQQNLPTLNTLLHTINTVTASMTIALPHRAENITTMLMDTRTKQRTSKQKRQQLLGILHSLSPVIYDAAHLIWFYNMRSQRHI